MVSRSQISAIITISLIIGSGIFFYLNQSGFFGFNISQIPYDQVEEQDTTIIFTGDNNQSNFDFSSWADLGQFLQNLSYGFYDTFSPTQDLPLIPPIDPSLAPEFLPLLNSIIFNVTPADPPKYWKMTAYDYYDGGTWGKSSSNQIQLNTISLSEVPPGAQIYEINMNISHTIQGTLLLPILSPDQLILTNSLIVSGDSSLLGFSLSNDTYGSAILEMTFSSEGDSTITYQVTFNPLDLSSMQSNSLFSSSTPGSISSIYLQLPNARAQYLLDNPLLAGNISLFEEYAQTHSVYNTALQVLGYMQSNFIYDPMATYPDGNLDRAEWFFQNGGGTSLDFATAYSVFLRCLNISSRVVYGFLPGEKISNTRIIRGWNTHLWVEVWNPVSTDEDNWVQFDPTPLTQNITDLVGQDPLMGDVTYSLLVSAENNPIFITTRGTSFELEVFLYNNSIPMDNYEIWFYDETEQYIITTATTNSSGIGITNFSYNSSSKIGAHPIRAYIPELPLVRNYSVVLIDGSTNLVMTALPNPPQNVTRTIGSIYVSGILSDPSNSQPISGQTITIQVDGIGVGSSITDNSGQFSLVYIPSINDENKNTAIQAFFDGSFSVIIEGYLATFPPLPSAASSSPVDYVDIVASTIVTTQVNVTAATPGEWIRIYGTLTFDNGSEYSSQSIEVYWRDYLGEILLGSPLTNGAGYYYIDYQIPYNFSGQVKIFSVFLSVNSYVLSSYTDPTIYVGEEKITQLDSSLTLATRGTLIHISGLLTNSTDNPLIGRTVITQFYFNDTQTLIDTFSSTTNSMGIFEFDYIIPQSFEVGTYLINCTTTSPVVIASEEIYLNITSTTSISFNINPIFVVPGENFNISGSIIDDNGVGLNQLLSFYLNGQFTSQVVSSNGDFIINNQILTLGITSSTVNVTLLFTGDTFYQNSVSTNYILAFSQSTVGISVNPDIIPPGGTMQINVSAIDNYGRNIYQRRASIFLNNTLLTNITLVEGDNIIEWGVPNDTPNGPITIYGVLDTDIQSNYISDTITVQEIIGMQLTTDMMIVLGVVIVVIVISVIGFLYYRKRKRGTRITRTDLGFSDKLLKFRSLLSSGNKKEALLFSVQLIEDLIGNKYNIRKKIYQTIREFSTQVIEKTDINSKALYELIKAYEKLKYSKTPLNDSEFNQSIQHFRLLYNQITGDDFSIG